MTAWVLAALDRLPPRWRRVAVGAAAMLLVAAAVTALTLQASSVAPRRGPPRAPAPVVRRTQPSPPVLPTARRPVSATELRRGAEVAERFAVSYLSFVYGRANARSVAEVTPALRTQLSRGRSPVTPIERGRRPRVLSLHMVGTMPGFVVATAIVDDGGIAPYRLRFTLGERSGRWLVGTVEEG